MKKSRLLIPFLLISILLFGCGGKGSGSVIPVFAEEGLKDPLKIEVKEHKFLKESGRFNVKISIKNDTEYDFNEISYVIKINDECKDYFPDKTVILFKSFSKDTILSTPKRFNKLNKNAKEVKDDPRNKNMRVPDLEAFSSVLLKNVEDGDKFIEDLKEIIVEVTWDTGSQFFHYPVK